MSQLFLSGPFSPACSISRILIRTVAKAQGIDILEKSGAVEKSSARLIEEADAVVLVHGGEAPAVEDVWGMSLVESEMRYASVRKKPVLVVLTEPAGSIEEPMWRLRQHLKRQLNGTGAVRTLTEIRDDINPLLGELAAHHARTRKYDVSFPQQIQQNLQRHYNLPEDLVEDLCDPQVAPSRIDVLAQENNVYVPSVSELESALEKLVDFIGNWEETARPIFSDRVFISYSHDDVEVAEDLQQCLSESGLTPWRDQQDLRAGDQFADILRNEIEKSGVFVVLISEESAESEWVNREVKHALEMKRQYGRDVYFILPVRLEGTPPDAIKALADYDHLVLDPSDVESDVEDLVEDLRKQRSRAVERS